MAIPGLSLLTGGGGVSPSSSASAQGGRSGDVGGSKFTFGGINTGSAIPPTVWVVAAGFAALVVFLYFRKR